MRAMGLDTEPEGSAMAFLRRGYKVGGRCLLVIEDADCIGWCIVSFRLGRWVSQVSWEPLGCQVTSDSEVRVEI